MRKFAIAKGYEDKEIQIPKRSTQNSAGYDFESAEDVTIPPISVQKNPVIVKTGIKAYMNDDEVLEIFVRSSTAIKKGLTLPNNVGIIDSDYVDNPDNDGQIGIPLWNFGTRPYKIKKGERIAQGIFTKFLKTDDDHEHSKTERIGGVGSTGNQ